MPGPVRILIGEDTRLLGFVVLAMIKARTFVRGVQLAEAADRYSVSIINQKEKTAK